MGDRHAAIIGGERADHRGRGIALHNDAIRLLRVHHLAQPGQQPCGQPVERLARLHQVEVDVGGQPGDRQYLIEQPAMLGGDTGSHGQARHIGQCADHGEQLDRLWPGAKDQQDFWVRRHGPPS